MQIKTGFRVWDSSESNSPERAAEAQLVNYALWDFSRELNATITTTEIVHSEKVTIPGFPGSWGVPSMTGEMGEIMVTERDRAGN